MPKPMPIPTAVLWSATPIAVPIPTPIASSTPVENPSCCISAAFAWTLAAPALRPRRNMADGIARVNALESFGRQYLPRASVVARCDGNDGPTVVALHHVEAAHVEIGLE